MSEAALLNIKKEIAIKAITNYKPELGEVKVKKHLAIEKLKSKHVRKWDHWLGLVKISEWDYLDSKHGHPWGDVDNEILRCETCSIDIHEYFILGQEDTMREVENLLEISVAKEILFTQDQAEWIQEWSSNDKHT